MAYSIVAHTGVEVRAGTVTVGGTAVSIRQAPAGALAIAATLTPPPNAADWNNSPVTVSFTCVGPYHVSANVTVTEDGGHDLARTATNEFDQSASITVAVFIDTTAPLVAITSPLPGALVTPGMLTVSGHRGRFTG